MIAIAYILAAILILVGGIFVGMFLESESVERKNREPQTTERQPSQAHIGTWITREHCPDCGAMAYTPCSPGCHIAAQVEAALVTVKS